MKASRATFVGALSVVCLICILTVVDLPRANAIATETLVWQSEVFSFGVPVLSPILKADRSYRITAEEIWFYDDPKNLAADAMYYTTDPGDSWDWLNNNTLPDGHSFLQIDGKDVNWGPFSNGNTFHRYTIMYVGAGAALSFQIVDWLDQNNNVCHLLVKIYEIKIVGGYIVDAYRPGGFEAWAFGTLILGLAVAAPIVACLRKGRKS